MQKITEKQKAKSKEKAELHKKQVKFFLDLWDELSDRDIHGNYVRCFETGVKLYDYMYRENSCCYSHILPKSKYPEFRFEKWNVKIVHPMSHAQYESNPEKTPKQNNLKKELLESIKSNTFTKNI